MLQRLQTSCSSWTFRSVWYTLFDPECFNLVTNPPYQRGYVWSLEKKRALWKSILLGIPIGVMFFNIRSADEPYYLIDGKQRLEAIRAFRYGKLTLPREWFSEEDLEADAPSDFVGFEDLCLALQRRLGSSYGSIAVYETRVPDEASEAEIYLLINSTGSHQTPEDLARARRVADNKPGEV